MCVCVSVCVCMQRFYKKAAAFVLRAVAKHSPELSQAVVACGGVDALVLCLEEFDPGVKEAAAWALGYIARHNARKEDPHAQTSMISPFRRHLSPRMLRFLNIIQHSHVFVCMFPASFPSPCSAVPVRCGRGCCPPAGVVSHGARDCPQTHRSLHAQRHLQTHARAGADRGGQRCHRTPGTDDPQPRRQTQGNGPAHRTASLPIRV